MLLEISAVDTQMITTVYKKVIISVKEGEGFL
jgi:hypothetical protein